MQNLKTPFNFVVQTQKQKSWLYSSQNYMKNRYKIDLVLNKRLEPSLYMHFETHPCTVICIVPSMLFILCTKMRFKIE